MDELTTAEAAAESGYSPRTIQSAVSSGQLPSLKRGGRRLIPRSSFTGWMEAKRGDHAMTSGGQAA